MIKSLMKHNPVNDIFRLLFPLIVFSVLLIASCSKPAGNIGVNIQPEDSKLNLRYSDTTTVYAYSSRIDSIFATNLTWNGLGSFNDPVFGVTTAGFYTQFLLSQTKQEFGEDRVLDSLVLQLDYAGIFADTNTTLKVHVYEMLEKLDPEGTYYSNLKLPIGSQDYGNISFVPHPNDSVIIGGTDTIPPVLRLNLSKNNPGLGEKLLAADTNAMKDSETFWDYFAGLYVIAEPVNQGGCLVEFNLTTSLTGMTLYYHNKDKDSLRFDYLISTSAVRVSRYEHNYTNADQDFRQQVVEGDTALGEQKFYLQGLGGVKTTVKLPYLEEWRKLGKIGINEAKLIFNGNEKDPYLGAPDQLILYAINKDGNSEYLPDYNEGDVFFGGTYQSSTNNYTFRITRYIQSMISDTTKENHGLSLFITSPGTTPNRFILNGQDQQVDSVATVKLQIIYTDLN